MDDTLQIVQDKLGNTEFIYRLALIPRTRRHCNDSSTDEEQKSSQQDLEPTKIPKQAIMVPIASR